MSYDEDHDIIIGIMESIRIWLVCNCDAEKQNNKSIDHLHLTNRSKLNSYHEDQSTEYVFYHHWYKKSEWKGKRFSWIMKEKKLDKKEIQSRITIMFIKWLLVFVNYILQNSFFIPPPHIADAILLDKAYLSIVIQLGYWNGWRHRTFATNWNDADSMQTSNKFYTFYVELWMSSFCLEENRTRIKLKSL